MTLPIDAIRDQIVALFAAHRRVIVTAETGAGKSTRLPRWLAEVHKTRVMVVEPRRVACRALATYLAAQDGTRLGERYGYIVRFADHARPDTQVVFVTPGVALRLLAESPKAFGAVIIDEYHERSWQTDLVVTLLASRFADRPLVITSATIDAADLAQRYGAPTIHATGRSYPVDVIYRDDASRPSLDDLPRRAADATRYALRTYDGDVLVFLPGMGEIRGTERALGQVPADIVVVHGSVTPERLVQAFAASDRRRVFLATNIAETSVTLPGVRVVIDSGLARMRIHRGGRAALATVPITEDAMTQRCGRAGRVGPGVCLRLYAARYRPQPTTPPEIERTELDDLVLQSAAHGLAGAALRAAPWPSPPPVFALDRAEARLRRLGALDGDGITALGARLSRLPVSAEEAAVLADAPDAIRADVADLVALVQGRPLALLPLEAIPAATRDDVRDARETLLRGATSEVEESLRLLRRAHPRTHGVSRQRLQEARQVASQLRQLVGATGDAPFDAHAVAAHFIARLPASVFVLRTRAQRPPKRGRLPSRLPWGNGSVEVEIEPYRPYVRDEEIPSPKAGIVLETEWLGLGGTRVTGRGRMLLPCPIRLLDAPTIGELCVTAPRWIKGASPAAVSAQVERTLAGVTIAREERTLRGAPLCDALAGFLLDGRLIPDGGPQVRDALHLWALLAAWPDVSKLGGKAEIPEAPASPQAWLAAHLATLGVDTAADLELLEATDLLPDLEAITGLPVWTLEKLGAEFPRLWTDHGSHYLCAIDPVRQRVVLSPHGAAAKKAPDPNPARLPRFRGFRVDYQQASRQIRLR